MDMNNSTPEIYCRQVADKIKNWYVENFGYGIDSYFVNFEDKWTLELDAFEKQFGLLKPNITNDSKRNKESNINLLSDLYYKKSRGTIQKKLIKKYLSSTAPIQKVLCRIMGRDNNSIKEPYRTYPYNTIFILPSLSSRLNDIELEPLICHEFFHIIQYELGFAERYPLITEGTALFVEKMYTYRKRKSSLKDSLRMDYNLDAFDEDWYFAERNNAGKASFIYERISKVGFASTLKVLEEKYHLSLNSNGLFMEILKSLLDDNIQELINERCLNLLGEREINMLLN